MLLTIRVKPVLLLLSAALIVFPAMLAAKPALPAGDYQQGRSDAREFARTTMMNVGTSQTNTCCLPSSCAMLLLPILAGTTRESADRPDGRLANWGFGSYRLLPMVTTQACCMAPFSSAPVRHELRLQPVFLIGRSAEYAQGYVEGVAR
jgi:hypothetical protein